MDPMETQKSIKHGVFCQEFDNPAEEKYMKATNNQNRSDAGIFCRLWKIVQCLKSFSEFTNV